VQDPLQATRRTTPFRGAILTVGMRWTDRLLGLLSTLILARLLVPEDFGLVAMATVVAGLLDVLLDLGVAAALVQNTAAEHEHFDTAWTLRLCQAAVAAFVLAIAAPFVADFYDDERVSPIMYVIALSAFVGGLENIGTVSFQKNLEFGRDFQFFFLKRVFAVAFTITAALLLRSYWALVLGSLFSRCAGVFVSYRLSPFRPRLSLSRFSAIWSYSQWNIVAAVGQYLALNASRFIIGKREDASIMGAYAMGEEIASMPTTELLAPLGRVMFPVFAAAKHDPPELLRVVRLALAVQALLAMPAGVGIALVAHDAIGMLLGEKWSSAASYTEIIGLASVALALCHSSIYMLSALGQIKRVAAYNWGRVAMLVLLVVVAFPSAGALGIARAYLATAFGGLLIIQLLAYRALPGFGFNAFLAEVWRPIVSTAVMALVVTSVGGQLGDAPRTIRLLAMIVAGAAAYGGCVIVLWRAAGCPAGAETYLLDKLGIAKALVRNR
jgi:lipopolysaccharide exporter